MAGKVDVAGINLADVESIFSVLKGGAISAACLRLDATLNDKNKRYIDKVEALVSVLENVLTDYLSHTSPEQTILLFEFLHRHTLHLVLHGDWGKNSAAKLHMNVIFNRFEELTNKKNIKGIQNKVKTLLELFPNPWGNPTLNKILNNEPLTDDEALTFIKLEMGVVLIIRLEIMAEARLYEQALRLIDICLKHASQQKNSNYFEENKNELVCIKDIYIFLLVKINAKNKICTEIGKMGVTKSLEFVRRCVKGNCMVRLKKSRLKTAEYVAKVTITLAMLQPVTEEDTLYELMKAWINFYPDSQTVFRLLRSMVPVAVSSHHIYLLGTLVIEQYGVTEKAQCIELYIRALNLNLNELEKHKAVSDQEKIKESEVLLATGFLLLADYLQEDVATCRECVLSAFSLNPTTHCYYKIKQLAIDSGKLCPLNSTAPEDNCENNQSSMNCEKHTHEISDSGLKIDTGQPTEPQIGLHDSRDPKQKQANEGSTTTLESDNSNNPESQFNILPSPIQVSDAQKLGISQTLFDDLVTVISSARFQVLNWNLDWSTLSKQCEAYLLSGKKVRSSEKELKYLNIDYNQFKDWPKNKVYDTGIEKGFEQYVDIESLDEEISRDLKLPDKCLDETADIAFKDPIIGGDNIPLNLTTDDNDDFLPTIKKRKVKKGDNSFKMKGNATEKSVQSKFVKKIGKGRRASKVELNNPSFDCMLSNHESLTSIRPLHKPYSQANSINYESYGDNDLIDIVSIEDDAQKMSSPVNVSELNISINSNHSADYCIAENDLPSPFSNPCKYSDPIVLKSLRMYRSKKPYGDVNHSSKPRKGLQRFSPILNTIDLHPRVLSRPIVKKEKSEMISMDNDNEPEVIDLTEEENSVPTAKLSPKTPLIMKNKITLNFEDIITSNNSFDIKSAFSKPVNKKDLARSLGLKSLSRIRPATTETTVQVVQLPNTAPNSTDVMPNSSTVPATTIFTMTSPVHSQGSSNTGTVIYTTAQHTSSSSSHNSPSNTVPQQTTSLFQGRPVTNESSTKPLVSNNLSPPSRTLNTSTSQSNTSCISTSPAISETIRNFFTLPQRQIFSTSPGFSARESPEHTLYNPPVSSPIRTPSPHDSLMSNSTLGVIRVQQYPRAPSSESSQSLPNLSSVKTPVCTRSPTSNTSRHTYMRNSVGKTSTITSQSHSMLSSNRQATQPSSISTPSSLPSSSRSMQVTPHIQRIGFPPESSQTQNNAGIQMKYLLKEGMLGIDEEKQNHSENESDPPNMSITLNAGQNKPSLQKSSSLKEKVSSDQDEQNSGHGASLPKFQQAFGRPMYQNSSTTSNNNASLASSNGPTQINFAQQLQVTNMSSNNATSGSICSVLAKSVQTSKDSDISSKICSNEDSPQLQTLSESTSPNTVQGVNTSTNKIDTQLTSNFIATAKPRTNPSTPAILSQTPVKIFCKVPVTLANSNLLQGKSLAILKTSVPSDKVPQTQAKGEVDNKAKETVIRSNMSALLAAALQTQPQLRTVNNSSSNQANLKSTTEVEKKKMDQSLSSLKASQTKNFRKIPVSQQPVGRYTKPLTQGTIAVSGQNVSSTSVVTIPIRTVLTSGQQSSRLTTERIEVRSEGLASSSTQDDSSGSSLLDQQLKEFESVFNKVKKTSQLKEMTNSTSVQNQSHLSLNQQILLTQPVSSSPNVEFTSSNHTALFQTTSTTNTIHDLQGERVSLTFINQPTSGTTSTLITATSQKITSTPVVVVQSCSNSASPALSINSQSSSSPAPPSTPGSSSGKIANASLVKQNNKPNKSKPTSKVTPTTTLKLSTIPKPQQKPQEDEQTTQRIYAILDKYAEQLRNSPELKNKPAPRRRSNPPTNPSHNSKRKKSTQTSKSKLPSQQASCSSGMEMSPGSEDLRTIGSEDSSNGVSQLSQSLNSPQSRPDASSTPTGGDVSSETSESLDSRDTRIQPRLVLTETTTGQNRTVIVQDSLPNQVLNVNTSKLLKGKSVVVPQLVLPNVSGVQKMQLFPVPTDGRSLVVTKVPKMYRVHQVTMPRGTTSLPILGSGAVVLRPMCGTPTVKQVKLPSTSNISTQGVSNVIPSSSHSFSLAHDSTLESGDAVNLNLDNAILLNSTTPQSISFVHRSIPSSTYQIDDNSVTTVSSGSSTQKTTVAYTTSDINVSYLKQGSVCSSINVTPTTTQDTKSPLSCVGRSSELTCIRLNEVCEYTRSEETLVISQSNTDNNRWSDTDTSSMQISDSIKNDGNSEYCNFQSTVKTMMDHRSTSLLKPKQDRFIEIKKCPENSILLKNELEEREQDKPERDIQQSELCDDGSISSDSAGSGRAKTTRTEEMTKTGQDTGSPWPYNVTKIQCIVKSESPTTTVKEDGVENQSLPVGNSQICFKKKPNNADNNIYHMPFKRSDRVKPSSKELERNCASLERDLRLQKSLSEECEDLGVDEPSTSDLFPEAELLLDPDHSSRDSQLDLLSETFISQINSSSSCDSREMSPKSSFRKRPAYKINIRSPSISKASRFVPVCQFPEESTNATLSSTRDGSSHSQIISFKARGNLGPDSDISSSSTTKPLDMKDNRHNSVLRMQHKILEENKSSSSGISSPIERGDSTESSNHYRIGNSLDNDTRCRKESKTDCSDITVDLSDSDSNVETINLISSVGCPHKPPFVPIPNPASSSPFTYSGSRSILKRPSRKPQLKQDELWKKVLKANKEDLDSDMSDLEPLKVLEKKSISTDEDVLSEDESAAKNGLGTENVDTELGVDKLFHSLKTKRKRTSSLLHSSFKNKVQRMELQNSEELILELPTSTGSCQNFARYHDASNRRSSLRGHIKKNCPCCNGLQDKSKPHIKSSNKCDRILSCPSPSQLILGSNKKKSNRSLLKSSHITKKR